MNHRSTAHPLAIVGIGGGTGAPNLMKALESRLPHAALTIVCAVSDSGRSTGVARTLFGVAAPGDLRHCLSTLARNRALAELMEQRLTCRPDSTLDGMAIGNIVLAGLAQSTGSIGSATEKLAELLEVEIGVFPASIEDIHLAATLEDGTVVESEFEVRRPGKGAIRALAIRGEVKGVYPPAAAALRNADWILLGPGSLWTSLGAVLAVKGVHETIRTGHATIAFVANTTTQPGQTDGMTLLDHVDVIRRLVGRLPDVVIANDSPLSDGAVDLLAKDGLNQILPSEQDRSSLERGGSRLIAADLISRETSSTPLWQKLHTAYHDMNKVAELMAEVVSERARARTAL